MNIEPRMTHYTVLAPRRGPRPRDIGGSSILSLLFLCLKTAFAAPV